MDQCPGCGAVGDPPCEELFHRLLALDHSRAEPWGPLHGIVVAAYRMQHERSLGEQEQAVLLELLRVFVNDGVGAAQRLTASRVRSNSHRSRKPASQATPPGQNPRSREFRVTIADVAGDGEFPAEGHSERVAAWAEAVLDDWGR